MKTLIRKLATTHAGYNALVLRVPVGIIVMAHGSQKLFGWFGGGGLEGTAHWMASIGLNPGLLMATLSGGAEFFGGLALLLGLLVRPAALLTGFTMLMAIFSVHIDHGLFLSNNGYEYALALLAATVSLAFSGSGKFGVDNKIVRRLA